MSYQTTPGSVDSSLRLHLTNLNRARLMGFSNIDRLLCCSQAQAGSSMEASQSQTIRPHADDAAVSTELDGVVDLTKDLPADVAEDDVPLSQRLSSRKLSRKSRSQLPSIQPEPARPHASGPPSDPRLSTFPNHAPIASAPGKFLVLIVAAFTSPEAFFRQPCLSPRWQAFCRTLQPENVHGP